MSFPPCQSASVASLSTCAIGSNIWITSSPSCIAKLVRGKNLIPKIRRPFSPLAMVALMAKSIPNRVVTVPTASVMDFPLSVSVFKSSARWPRSTTFDNLCDLLHGAPVRRPSPNALPAILFWTRRCLRSSSLRSSEFFEDDMGSTTRGTEATIDWFRRKLDSKWQPEATLVASKLWML